jgi:aryl-alcohol dehydrogenase-like predicted oxidoreductase
MKHLQFKQAASAPPLPRIGLGCMRMSYDDAQNRAESQRTIHAALDAGVTFLDTGDFYGHGQSERVLGEALQGVDRDSYFVSVKFGHYSEDPNAGYHALDVSPQAVERCLAGTLRRLRLETIDLYQPCGLDPHYPIEETVGAIARMIEKGYVKHIGLSMLGEDVLRRALAVHPILAVELEYSILARDIEKRMIPAARELGVGLVTFGTLAAGLLGGGDERQLIELTRMRLSRRIGDEAPQALLARLSALREIAQEKGITLPQLATAWALRQGEDVMALSGSIHEARLRDVIAAAEIDLTAQDLARIDEVVPESARYGFYLRPDVRL